MGIYHHQWALPKNTKILDKAKTNRTYCEYLQFIRFKEDEDSESIEKEYLEDIKEACKINPVTGLHFEFDKNWDSVLFLISKQRRLEGCIETYDIYGQAIFGEKEINPEAKTIIGLEIKYIDHSHLSTLISLLKGIKFNDFKNVEKEYEERIVYGKRFYNIESCWRLFQKWLEFLSEVESNECYIICFSN